MKRRTLTAMTALPLLLAGCTATRTTYVDPYAPQQSIGMHWTAYEVFSVISGIVLFICSLMPRIRARDRFWSLIGGVVFIGYAIYTGHQISGTYSFSVAIFIIPVAAVIWLLMAAFGGGPAKSGPPSKPSAEGQDSAPAARNADAHRDRA